MAKQVGAFKFLGRLGNLFGYMIDGEYYVRTIGKVDKAVRKHAPQYEETRQNEAEFGVATRFGGLFRQAMMHITQRWTTKHYPPKVIQLMMETSKSDTKHVKGKRSVNYGLKNGESQLAFRRLEIFTKKNYTHYRGSLMHETNDPLVWKMNHQALWSRRDDGDTKSVKLGLLHVDFDRKIAKYEDALSITCKRNDQIEQNEVRIVPTGDIKLPWTFVIQQVWRDGDIYEPTGMLFMNVLQVIEGEMANEHGLHSADGHGLQSGGSQKGSIMDENGVNWDAFLDGYLCDGFENWVVEDEEKDVLLTAEDLNKEEIDLQVALGLVGVEVAALDGELGMNGAETVQDVSERGSFEVKVEDEQCGCVHHSLDKDDKFKDLLLRFEKRKIKALILSRSNRKKERISKSERKGEKFQELIFESSSITR